VEKNPLDTESSCSAPPCTGLGATTGTTNSVNGITAVGYDGLDVVRWSRGTEDPLGHVTRYDLNLNEAVVSTESNTAAAGTVGAAAWSGYERAGKKISSMDLLGHVTHYAMAGVLTQGGLPVNGVGDSGGRAIAVDGGGNAYLTGQTDSASFPVTLLDPRSITATVGAVPLHGTCTLTPPSGQTGGPCYDAFVTKLGPTGSISYSTYLGGGRDDYGYGLALDGGNTGLVYVTGRTESSDFPISGTLQSFNGGTRAACHETDCPDAFVAKLDTTMTFTTVGTLGALGTLVGGNVSALQHPSLLWSTYLGGSGADEGTGIALDPGGNVYVTGDTAPLSTTASSDFPTTTGAYSTTAAAGTCAVGPCADVFVAKLRDDGSRLTYASRFGGSGDDRGAGIAVDTAGHAYLTGSTTSADFPLLGSLQGFNAVATGAGATMAFVTKLNVGGSGLWYSTLLGGSGGDAGAALAVDGVGDVSVAGQTGSTDVLSARPAARQEMPARQSQMGGAGAPGQPDGFTASLDATTRYLTYSYDGVQRLTGVSETLGNAYGYAYDLAGNRTDAYLNGVDTQRTAYNGASEAVSVTTPGGILKPTYDAAGNLTFDGSAGYSYDALNRLTTLTSGSGSPTPSASYGYNGDGVLVGQTVGATGTTYTQDLAVPAAQAQVLGTTVGATQNGGTATATDYLYATDGQGATSRLASTAGGGASHTWYVSDLQGSVRYTEGDSGAPAGGSLSYAPGPQQYDPYGAVARGADGAGPTPQTFGYRGEVQDAATGLVTLRARMYNPATGSFLTRDPLLQQTNQPYSYAGSDPVNNADPTGQVAFPPRCSNDPVRNAVEVGFLRKALLGFNLDTNCNIPIPGVPGGGAEVVVREAQNGSAGSLYVVAPLEQLLPGYGAVAQRALRDVRALSGTGPRCTLVAGAQLYHPGRFLDGVSLVGVGLGGLQLGGADAFGAVPYPQFDSAGGPVRPVTAGAFVAPGSGAVVPGLIFYQQVSPVALDHSCSTGYVGFGGLLHCGYQLLIGDELDTLGSKQGGFGGALAKFVAVVDIASNVVVIVPLVGQAARLGVKGLSKAALSVLLKTSVDVTALHGTEEFAVHLTPDLLNQAERGVDAGVGGKTRSRILDVSGGCGCFVGRRRRRGAADESRRIPVHLACPALPGRSLLRCVPRTPWALPICS